MGINVKDREKEIALKISSKLEYSIKTNKVKAQDIAEFIGISEVNFSKGRNMLKKGKFPPNHFLIGISLFFKENFFEF